MFKKIKVLIPSLQYLVTPDSSFYYHVVYIHVHTERKLRKENNLHRKINTRSCIRHVTDLITYGTRYSDNCVNGFVNGWHDPTFRSPKKGGGEGWDAGGGGCEGLPLARSSPLGVYFADFLRPESFFFFLPIYKGAPVSFRTFLFKRHFHSGDTKYGRRKMFTCIFVFVTSIEGTPLFTRNGHFLWVPRPGFNLHSEDTLAIKKWLTTKI